MSAIFHVDISLSGSGYAGTDADPFSWADVKQWLTTNSTTGGTGTFYDGIREFTSNGFDVEFRLRGTGELFSQTNSIALSLINFVSAAGKIVFTCDDVSRYGLPVLLSDGTANALAANSVFMSFSACNNLNFEFRNCILDINSTNTCTLFGFDEHHSAKIKIHNNIVLSRRESTSLVRISRSSISSRVGVGFNTVLINATSASSNPLVVVQSQNSSEAVSLFWGGNYVARHNNSTYVPSLVDIQSYSTLYYGGNRYGGNVNLMSLYSGSGSRLSTGSSDNICDYVTQGIENDTLFGGSETYSAKRTSVFWPTNAGLLLRACPNHDVSQPYVLGIGAQDIRGFARSGYDAGAFEKNHVPTQQSWHVDVSASGLSEATGRPESPLTLTDMLSLYKRLAPVVDEVSFIIRGDNSAQSAVPEFDLGPLSRNTTAGDRKFGGTGSVRLTGYRTHVLTPPTLKINRIKPSNACTVVIEKMKLDWASGTDFIVPDPSIDNSGSKFVLRNNIIRSSTTTQQSIIDSGVQGPDFLVLGNVFYIRHNTGLGSGSFVFGAGNNVMSLNTIISPVPEIGVVGTGTTRFRGNYINIASGTWTFAGAVSGFNTSNSADIATVFEDPFAAFALSSWKFSGLVPAPLDIISVTDADPETRTWCGKDIRDLVRDASPFGAPLFDAGPYEYSYYIPQSQYKYVDLARSGSGHAGSIADRWSYEDLRNYLQGLNNSDTSITSPVEINCVNATNNAQAIALTGIEALPTGKIKIRSENPFSLAYIESPDTSSWLSISNSYGLIFELEGVVSKSIGYVPNITLSGEGFGSSVRAYNSAFWHKDVVCLVVVGAVTTTGSNITVSGISKLVGTGPGNIQPSSNPSTFAQNVVNVFNSDTVFATSGYRAQLLAQGVVGFTSSSASVTLSTNLATNIAKVKDTSVPGTCVRVGSSWDFVSIGCGFASIVDPGATSRSVSGIEYASGSTGCVGYSSFSGTPGADTAVVGNTSVLSDHNASHGYLAGFPGLDDHGSLVSSNKIANSISSESVMMTDFTPVGEALDIVHEAGLTSSVAAYAITYDALRNLRSQTAFGGTDYYDAGPVEANAVTSTSGYLGNADTLIAGLTPEGYSLNCRRDVDGLGFRIVGYAIGSSGYLMYDPKRVVGYAGAGAQAYGSLLVASNSFGSLDQVSVSFGSTVVTKQYNTMLGWSQGPTLQDTCNNIAQSFRNDPVFNAYCYCRVASNVVFFYSKLFGTVGNSFVLNATFGSVTAFGNGEDSQGVLNKVWPETSPYAAFDRFESPDPKSKSFVVRLDFDECNKPIGQIALIAEITSSSIASEVGDLYVYAFANTPLHVKHNREVVVKRVIMSF